MLHRIDEGNGFWYLTRGCSVCSAQTQATGGKDVVTGLWKHKCPNCGHLDYFDQAYPTTEYHQPKDPNDGIYPPR